MKKLFPVLLIIGLCVVAVVLLARLVTPAPQYDPVAAAAQERAIAQQETLAPVDTALAVVWRLVPLSAVIAALVLGVRYAWLRSRLVQVGGVPVVLDQLPYVAPSVLAGHAQSALAQAQRPNVPHSLTYSPHYSTRNDTRAALDAPALLDTEGEHAPLVAPTFAQLVDNGTIAPGAPLVLGWGEQGAVTGSWRALLSTGLGGLQGSGKTTTAASLLTQAALSGAKLLVVDPHAGEDDSLANRIAPLAPAYLAEPASDGRAILDVLRQARAELERRKRGSGERWPLIVCVDEWTSLLRGELADQLPAFIADLTQEGRKYNAYAFLLAQRWASADVGGGGVRNTLAAAYVHRMRPDEARYLTGLRSAQLPNDVLQLDSGEAYLLDTSGQLTKVRTPQITPADVEKVGRKLMLAAPSSTAVESPQTVQRKPFESTLESPQTAPTSPTAQTPEQARIMALFVGGESAADIVKELYGCSSGHTYNRRRNEVEATIRQALTQR